MRTPPHLWIITRKHPPAVGGMEEMSARIAQQLTARGPVTLVKWGRSQKLLPLFATIAGFRLCIGLLRRRVAVLFLGDPVLSALGVLARWCGVPVMVTVHGRDVLWSNPVYQAYLRSCFLNRMDTYVCISTFVRDLLLERGVPAKAICVIPLAVSRAASCSARDRSDAPVLLFLGRLVRRKGAAWFVAGVLPALAGRFPGLRLVVAGEGPQFRAIAQAAGDAGVLDALEMRGAVTHDEKWALLQRCTAVVMPNIEVHGDAEGFGLVALEAAACGKPVFAADLQGLRDAVLPGVTGWRLPSGDAAAWIATLCQALASDEIETVGGTARLHVERNHAWETIGQRYAEVVEELAHART
jgi:phosphatidylinositol alpha-1,6-mannosyltransferase